MIYLCKKMRQVIIVFALIANSYALFFNDLSGKLSSVKSSVGQLFSDVGRDLKQTYDCTVDAVEAVIYGKDKKSTYHDECKPNIDNNVVASGKLAAPVNIYISSINPTSTQVYNQIDATTKSDNLISVKLSHVKEIDKKLDIVEKSINHEYHRVDNMSTHLEHELADMAKNVDIELKKIEEDKMELHKTLIEIEKLHLEEDMHIEKTKNEIQESFNEILNKIDHAKQSDFKSEVKAIIKDVENNSSKTILEELEKWKDKEMKELEDIKKAEKDNSQSSKQSNITSASKTEVKEVSATSKPTTVPTTTTTTAHTTTTTTSSTTTTTTTTTKPSILTKETTPKSSDEYDGLIPKDPKAAAAAALKVFKKSIETKSVLDGFLNHLKTPATGVP